MNKRGASSRFAQVAQVLSGKCRSDAQRYARCVQAFIPGLPDKDGCRDEVRRNDEMVENTILCMITNGISSESMKL